jgi:hypothetical protein
MQPGRIDDHSFDLTPSVSGAMFAPWFVIEIRRKPRPFSRSRGWHWK